MSAERFAVDPRFGVWIASAAAPDDDRVTCNDCMHFVRRQCTNAIAAGMSISKTTTPIGPALSSLKQRCPAFAVKASA